MYWRPPVGHELEMKGEGEGEGEGEREGERGGRGGDGVRGCE